MSLAWFAITTQHIQPIQYERYAALLVLKFLGEKHYGNRFVDDKTLNSRIIFFMALGSHFGNRQDCKAFLFKIIF